MGLKTMLLAGADEHDLTKLAEYQRDRRLRAGAEGARDELRRADRRAAEGEPARPRRRRLPDGPQGLAGRPQEPEAEVPGRQRRRVRAGRVQGPRGDGARAAPAARGLPDRRARDRVEGRLHLHPRRVPDRVRDPAGGRRRGARGGALRRRERDRLPRRRRVHLRRGDGAARLARGPARPAAAAAAVPAGPGPLHGADRDQQRLHDRDGAGDPRARRRRLRPGRHARLAGHRALLDLRQRREAGQLRARARHLDARADLHARGRDRRRPPAEGGHPGRLLGAGADRAADRRAARLRLAGRDRDVLRRRLADRGRRALLHGAARAPLDEVLHARVLRQVHALPRGNALDGAAPREDRGRRRRRRPTSSCCERSATAIEGKSLCALGDFAVWPVQSYFDKWHDEWVAHVEQGGCPFGGESSLEGIFAPSDQHTHSPVAEVPA